MGNQSTSTNPFDDVNRHSSASPSRHTPQPRPRHGRHHGQADTSHGGTEGTVQAYRAWLDDNSDSSDNTSTTTKRANTPSVITSPPFYTEKPPSNPPSSSLAPLDTRHRRMFSDSPQSSEGSHLHTVITGSSSAAPSSGDPRAHLEQPIIVTEDAQMEPLAPPRIKPTKSMPPEYLNDPLDPKSPGSGGTSHGSSSSNRFLKMPKQLVKQMSLKNLSSFSPSPSPSPSSYRPVGRTLTTSRRLGSTSPRMLDREAMEVPQSAPVEGPRHGMDSLFASATRANRLRNMNRIERTPLHPSLVEVNLENNRRSTPRQHRSTSSNGGARADERGKPEIKEGQGTEPAVSTEWEYHRIDGRRGWEAVFWSFLANFSITSSLTTFSAYALYYQMSFSASDPIMLDDTLHGIHEPQYNATSYTYIALTGTLLGAACAWASTLAGVFADRSGPRSCACVGSVCAALTLMVSSYSDDLHMLSFVQGALQGVGIALVFIPAHMLPSHWFERYRGLATGISLAGAAAGGAVMTFVCHTLLTNKGLATALRVQALIALVVGVVSAIGMQTRVMFTKPAKMLWNKTLRDTRTVVLMTVAFLAGVAHFAQHLCMPGFSQLLGMQGAQTLEVVYISSGATVVGLVLSGIVADRTGYIAGIGLSQFAMGVFTLALWLPAKSKSLYYAYAVVYGLTAGVLGAVVPASVVQMFGIARAFTMLGVTVSMAGLGMLLTLPAIINFQHQISEHKSVQYLIGISGGLSILSGIIALLLPYLQRRHLVRMLNKSVWTQQ